MYDSDMSRVLFCEAIVLRAYDIGEADRFCIFFTRECGVMPARARGARRIHSVFGGGVLPFRHVHVELVQTRGCWMVRSARAIPESENGEQMMISSFVLFSQGVELLLNLIEDEEPLAEVFDLLMQFMRRAAVRPQYTSSLTVFTLRLLHLLGLLALEPEDLRFSNLLPEEQRYVRFCTCCVDFSMLCAALPQGEAIAHFCRALVPTDIRFPQRSLEVSSALFSDCFATPKHD